MARDPLDFIVVTTCAVTLCVLFAAWQGSYTPAAVFAAVVTIAFFAAPRRRFPTAEAVCGDVKGKVALVTGPTSGIGEETARVLALNGCHVVLAARSQAKLAATRGRIEESCAKKGVKAQLSCVDLDLNDLDSVRSCAAAFKKLQLPLHILINNAGIMAVPTRQATKQGIEQQVGVCHVAHALLTQLLQPELERATPSRVVCVSSMAWRLNTGNSFIDDSKLETAPYSQWGAYGNAKVANLFFALELDERWSAKGVRAFSLHPGGIHTGLQDNVSAWTMFKWFVVTPFFFKSISQGAATTLHCATQPGLEASGGQHFDNCAPTTVVSSLQKKLGSDVSKRLWKQTDALLA